MQKRKIDGLNARQKVSLKQLQICQYVPSIEF